MPKLTLKQKIAIQQQEGKIRPSTAKTKPNLLDSQEKVKRKLALIMAAMAFLLYANTLGHGWVLDDDSVVKENSMTRKGLASLGEIFTSTYRAGWSNMDYELYRPVSKAVLAIEWQFWPDNPFPAHLVNVLLYALTGSLLFYALTLYLRGNLIAAFLASALFVAHAIHTEVVANIKSLDEILSFLFFVITIIFIHRYLTNGATRYLVLSLASYFLSLLSKESAVTFVLVVPLLLWFFTDVNRSKNLFISGALAALTVVFLLIRMAFIEKAKGTTVQSVEISVIDNVLAGLTVTQRLPTALYMMGLYLKLFFFPNPLVSDYSFNQIPVIGYTNWKFILALVIYGGLTVYAFVGARKRDPIAFSILYFFITASVASNILVLIGTSFGERLMYSPSLGFCIAIAFLITAMVRRKEDLETVIQSAGGFFKTYFSTIAVAALVIVLFSVKTIARNADWHDNLRLFSADVKNSPNSARTHFYIGNYLSQDSVLDRLGDDRAAVDANLDRALKELTMATNIYPQYGDAYQEVGKIYLRRKDFASAEEYYHKALGIKPLSPLYLNNYGNVLFNTGRIEEAKTQFEQAIRWNPTYTDAHFNLGSAYGVLGDNARAAQQDEAARQFFQKAILSFKKAIECDPDYFKAYRFLGLTYRNLGDESNAEFYLTKATIVESKQKR